MQLELNEKGQTASGIKLLRDNDDCVISLMSISAETFQGQFFNCLTMTESHKVKLAISWLKELKV